MSSSDCGSCLTTIPNIALYRCQTCTPNYGETSSENLFCEDCLVPHIRKGHSIVDSKGFEPIACAVHNFIVSEYCKTCDVLFCCKCLASHRKHECESLEEKALEVKTKVFSLLTDLENKEKPVQLRKTTFSKIVNQNKTDAEKISLAIESECNKLQENLLRDVLGKSKSNEKFEQNLENVCNELIDVQKSVRELLSESDQRLINNYSSVFMKVEKFQPMFESCTDQQELVVSFCSEELVRKTFENFTLYLQKMLTFVGKCNIFNIVGQQRSQIFRIADNFCGNIEVIKVNLVKDDQKFELVSRFQTTVGKNVTITHVYPLNNFLSDFTSDFIFLLSDRTAMTHKNGKFSPANYPECDNCLWPFKFGNSLYWSYWDPINHMVKLTNSKSCKFNSKSCPKIKMTGSYYTDQLFFIDENENKIIKFSVITGSVTEITSDTHQLDSVDCISPISYNLICVWSVPAKLAHLLRKDELNSSYTLVKQISWKNQPESISFSYSVFDFTFLPTITWDKNSTTFSHIFAIWAEVKKEKAIVSPPTSIKCDKCGKTFKRQLGLSDHRRMKHGIH